MSRIFSWLMSPLNRWELVEYSAATIVILGVLGEYLAEFHVFQYAEEEGRRRWVARGATLILLGGLALELLALVRTSQLYRAEISIANERAIEAEHGNLELKVELETKTLQLFDLQRDLAKTQGDAINRQSEVTDILGQEILRHSKQVRDLFERGDEQKIVDELKGKAVSRFEILYTSDDEEASALHLKAALVEAGWALQDVRPFRDTDVLEGNDDIPFYPHPPFELAGNWYAVSLSSKAGIPRPLNNEKPAIVVLMVALGVPSVTGDPGLPDGVVRIVIGKKPHKKP